MSAYESFFSVGNEILSHIKGLIFGATLLPLLTEVEKKGWRVEFKLAAGPYLYFLRKEGEEEEEVYWICLETRAPSEGFSEELTSLLGKDFPRPVEEVVIELLPELQEVIQMGREVWAAVKEVPDPSVEAPPPQQTELGRVKALLRRAG